MNNKTLLLTLSFTLGTLFTNAQSLPGFQWGEGMGTPDLSWTAQVGAKTYPKGKIFQAADYGLKNDSTRLSTAALQKAIDECHRSGGGTVEVAPGYYRIGAIYLKSNVNLHLNQGTTLIASENIDLYPEMRSRVAGIEMVCRQQRCLPFRPCRSIFPVQWYVYGRRDSTGFRIVPE